MTLTGPHSSLLGSLERVRASPSGTSMTLTRMELYTGLVPMQSELLCMIIYIDLIIIVLELPLIVDEKMLVDQNFIYPLVTKKKKTVHDKRLPSIH